jgi:hypothetical protein
LNDGKGHFTLTPLKGDLETDLFASGSIGMIDYDNDGVLDIWPSTIGIWQYFQQTSGVPLSRMRFYQGIGDGTFTDVSQTVGLPSTNSDGTDYRMIFGMTPCDVDLDGRRDMVIAEYGTSNAANHLYRNVAGKFVDIGKNIGLARVLQGGFTNSITCGDLDDDGKIDLMTAELHHAWYPMTDSTDVLMNTTPDGQDLKFSRPGRTKMGLDRPHHGGNWTEGDSQIFFNDIDNDGRKDITILSVNYPQQSASDPDWTHTWVYRQKDDGTFEDVTTNTPFWDKTLQSLGNGALIDIDNDGDLDLVTGTGTYNSEFLKLTNAIHVFRNEVGQAANMTRVRMIGKGKGFSNVSAIGARVEITVGGRTQQQEVQAEGALTFGLADACEIDTVVVHWPDGANTTTTFEHVPANYLLQIHEGESKIDYRKLDGAPAPAK